MHAQWQLGKQNLGVNRKEEKGDGVRDSWYCAEQRERAAAGS